METPTKFTDLGKAAPEASKPFLDLNSDGINDLRQSWFWEKVAKGAFFLGRLLPAHTAVHKAAEYGSGLLDVVSSSNTK